ncbi:MAG: DUF2508 family protein [Epulopiscium sp.]|nr:DUF2508 family protein [Candidatus Epulonipiscium sp.]
MEAIRYGGYPYDSKISNKLRRAMLKEERKMSEEERELLAEINEAYREMATSFSHFESATDPELIEYYTYKFKADQIKYGYLIRCMKKLYYSHHRS